MSLESGTYVSDLDVSNPTSGDPEAQGDDHLRLIKSTLKNTFPNAGKVFRFPDFLAKTGSYTILSTDANKLIGADSTGGAFDLTLPTLAAGDAGWAVDIVKVNATAPLVTIIGTVNGLAARTLANQWELIRIKWTGTAWYADPSRSMFKSKALSADTVLTLDDVMTVVEVDTTAGNKTITLPAAATARGAIILFKKTVAANSLIVSGTIDGAATTTLTIQYASIMVFSNGTTWMGITPALGLAIANTWTAQQTFNIPSVGSIQTLTDAATIAWDMSLARNAIVTLSASRTLDAPTGEVAQQEPGYLDVVMGGAGGWVVTWDASFKFAGGVIEPPEPTAGVTTRYQFFVRGANDIVIKRLWSSGMNSIGLWKEYDLGALNLMIGTVQTIAHGLGRRPSLVMLYVELTSITAGWAVGDRLLCPNQSNSASDIGISVMETATNVMVIVGEDNNPITLHNKTTGAFSNMLATAGKAILRIYS